LLLDRAESYIGVMIDDLILQGVTEPYRMLTARAEFRLALRADNASTRLTPRGIEVGMVTAERAAWFRRREADRRQAESSLRHAVRADAMLGAERGRDGTVRSLAEWCRFNEVGHADILAHAPLLATLDPELVEEVLEDARYAPYLERQSAAVRDLRANDAIDIPADFDFGGIGGLSAEMVERLSTARPETLGAAARVRGVTPAALAALLVGLKRRAA
jgi:tRNA uridine 5-carboxymethylaminomethyl modification enzyme